MIHCPVCEIYVAEEGLEFCAQCARELKACSSGMPEDERANYDKRLEIARRNWQVLQKLKVKPLSRFEQNGLLEFFNER